MRVDVLFVAYNRLAFTRETFAALIANTDWDLVETLYVADDGSSDGTIEHLHQAVREIPDSVPVELRHGRLGGPVAATNWYLDCADHGQAEAFAKVDNDLIVCPGWLNELVAVMEANPWLDVLGTEPFLGDPTMPPLPDRYPSLCSHVGGKGLIRLRAFGEQRMAANGYFGWTKWQTSHDEITKAWIAPDLPVFGLDQLPESAGPWRKLALDYEAAGWQRLWPCYADGATAYWDWWTPRYPVEEAA